MGGGGQKVPQDTSLRHPQLNDGRSTTTASAISKRDSSSSTLTEARLKSRRSPFKECSSASVAGLPSMWDSVRGAIPLDRRPDAERAAGHQLRAAAVGRWTLDDHGERHLEATIELLDADGSQVEVEKV